MCTRVPRLGPPRLKTPTTESLWCTSSKTTVFVAGTIRGRRKIRLEASAIARDPDDEVHKEGRRLSRMFYRDSTDPAVPLVRDRPSIIQNLPLWRVQWVNMPGAQTLLHVHVPHYIHMFDGVFSGPPPWIYGHLYLPGGSKNLGQEGFHLREGSQAPLVGTLMEVNKAVRLTDGKLIILATGVARIRVVSERQLLPYSRADVEIYGDKEEVESWQELVVGKLARMNGNVRLADLSTAMAAAASDVAAAVSRHWWSYELAVARHTQWQAPIPRDATNTGEDSMLVTELLQPALEEVVVSLPDEANIGRWNLDMVVQGACQVAEEALMQLEKMEPDQRCDEAVVDGERDGGLALVTQWLSGDAKLPSEELLGALGCVEDNVSQMDETGLALLEELIWEEMDVLTCMGKKIAAAGWRLHLPYGLLQLRSSSRVPEEVVESTERNHHPVDSESSGQQPTDLGASSEGGVGHSLGVDSSTPASSCHREVDSTESVASPGSEGVAQERYLEGSRVPAAEQPGDAGQSGLRQPGPQKTEYSLAASDGLPISCPRGYPIVRRAQRLSYALGVILRQGRAPPEALQSLLECPSTTSRLKDIYLELQEHRKVMVAAASLRSVWKE